MELGRTPHELNKVQRHWARAVIGTTRVLVMHDAEAFHFHLSRKH